MRAIGIVVTLRYRHLLFTSPFPCSSVMQMIPRFCLSRSIRVEASIIFSLGTALNIFNSIRKVWPDYNSLSPPPLELARADGPVSRRPGTESNERLARLNEICVINFH